MGSEKTEQSALWRATLGRLPRVGGWCPAAALLGPACLGGPAPTVERPPPPVVVAPAPPPTPPPPAPPLAIRVHTPGRPPSPPLSPAEQAAAARVAEVYAELFGEAIPAGGLRVSEAGRVALPMAEELDAEAIAEEWRREGLDTPLRREKATVARGPDGAWSHFLGSDPAGSDLWGEPDAVIAWMRLAAGWARRCQDRLGGERLARCTLQVGDFSWYIDARPDPLGHKDHRGACLDLRLLRKDGAAYEAWWDRPDDRPGWSGPSQGYDQGLTADFVAYAIAEHGVEFVFFNDPAVEGARPLPGHDDHLHLCMPPTAR
jgi:hypothetical protein